MRLVAGFLVILGEGDEYLTAPKRAPSHSVWRVSTVFSGRAVPICWKVSKPAGRSMKENLSFREEGRASRIRRPAYLGGISVSSCWEDIVPSGVRSLESLLGSLLSQCRRRVLGLRAISQLLYTLGFDVIYLFSRSLKPLLSNWMLMYLFVSTRKRASRGRDLECGRTKYR